MAAVTQPPPAARLNSEPKPKQSRPGSKRPIFVAGDRSKYDTADAYARHLFAGSGSARKSKEMDAMITLLSVIGEARMRAG